VVRLLDCPEHGWSLARAARELVEQEYAWARIGERLLAVYRQLTAIRGSPV